MLQERFCRRLILKNRLETAEQAAIENVSPAHIEKERKITNRADRCCMPFGKPFDFTTGLPRLTNPKPQAFDSRDYLYIQSVTNSILRLYNVDEQLYYRDKSGNVYPTLEKILFT